MRRHANGSGNFPTPKKEEEDEDKKGFVLPPIGWLVAAAVSLLVVLFASIYLSKNPLSSQGNEEVFAQNDPGEAPTKKNRPPVLDLTEDKNTPPPPPPSIGEKTAESDPVLMEEKPLIPSLEDAGRSNNAPAPMRDIPAEEPISEIMGDNSTFDDMDLEDAEADFDVEMEEIAEVVEEAEMEPIDNVFTSEASPTLTSPTSGGAVPKTTITQDGVNGISQRGVSSYNTPYYLENVQTKEKNKLFKKRDRKDEQQSKALENPPSRSLSSSSGTFEQDLNPPRVGNADVRMQDEMISQATGRASYEQQGFAQYSSGNYKGAIKSYEKYLKEDPSNTQARYYLGLSYLEEEKESKALAQFDFILQDESDPYYEDAEWYKAQTLLRMEQKTAAKEELEKIQAKPGKYKSRATESLKDLK